VKKVISDPAAPVDLLASQWGPVAYTEYII
jgi:hypothetical protein